MPKLVHSLKLTVHSKEKTVNREPFTLSEANEFTVNKRQRRLGFTLIEMLVVIAIIGALASVAFVSFTNAKEKSLDKRRKSDVQALKQALIAAKIDSGYYKNDLSSLAPNYIAKVPLDPLLRINYIYTPQPTTPDCKTTSTCTSFSLITCLDNANDKEGDDPINSGCTNASYTATSPQ